jgi:DNA-binding CsgD family transcriptional regulator
MRKTGAMGKAGDSCGRDTMPNTVDQSRSVGHSPNRACDPGGCTGNGDGIRKGACGQTCTTKHSRRRSRGQRIEQKSTKGKRRKAGTPRFNEGMSLATLAKEYIWLWDVRHGISTSEIAIREGISVRLVQFGVLRAEALEKNCPTEAPIRIPPLIPLFPLGPLTPQSACRHNGPIETGSLFCCVVCHVSGIDDHPGLQRDPLTDPASEPKPAPAAAAKKTTRETRKQRRQRVYGTSSLMSDS